MQSGKCQMPKAKGQMANGKWQMPNDKCQISDIGYRTSDIEHRTSNIGHRTSDIGHRTSDVGRRLLETVFEQLLDRPLAGLVDLARAGASEVRVRDRRHALLAPLRTLPAEPAVLLFVEHAQRLVTELGDLGAHPVPPRTVPSSRMTP